MRIVVVLAVALGLAVGLLVVMSLGLVVYPGALKLTAPVLCPDDQPDAFVVRTTVEDAEGPSTNFTLFCMGQRGQFTEVGTWRPLLLLFAGSYAALVVLGGVGLGVLRVLRR